MVKDRPPMWNEVWARALGESDPPEERTEWYGCDALHIEETFHVTDGERELPITELRLENKNTDNRRLQVNGIGMGKTNSVTLAPGTEFVSHPADQIFVRAHYRSTETYPTVHIHLGRPSDRPRARDFDPDDVIY